MPQFIISYLGGDQQPDTEESQKYFIKYLEWLSSLGSSAVCPMNPFKKTATINPDGTITKGSTTSMSGYTIIEAESMEKALSSAKDCAFLDINGSLEVSEIVQMPYH